MKRIAWGPAQLLNLSGFYWRTCALHAAVRLDLFSRIGSDGATAAAVAEGLGAHRRGVRTLLDALVAMELVEREEALYRCSEDILALLSRSSDRYLGDLILHHANLMESWSLLHESVATGEPARCRSATTDDGSREAFLLGMVAQGRLVAPLVTAALNLANRRRLLDVGGGPGAFAIAFCEIWPDLEADVFDLPGTAVFAERVIGGSGVSDRVRFVAGDYLVDPLPGGYDVAWVSHILHAENPERCALILAKAAQALVPGGLLLIHEFILDPSGAAPLFPALFSLNMLVGTDGGRSYREDELTAMMAEAGLEEVRRLEFEGPSQSGVLCGVAPR